MDWVIKILVNAGALWVAELLLPGIVFTGEWWKLLLVAFIFAAVNTFVRPVLRILTLPITVVTLGLFLVVINALMLLLTSAISSELNLGFSVDGFLTALVGAIIISFVGLVLSLVVGTGRRVF
ncbi:MAG: phage holin family protein [Candidatus Limnocylindria bacterium]